MQVDKDVSNDRLQLGNNSHHQVVDMDDTRELSSDAVTILRGRRVGNVKFMQLILQQIIIKKSTMCVAVTASISFPVNLFALKTASRSQSVQ